VYRLVSNPNSEGTLEKVKRLVLALVNMGRRTSSRRDQNFCEEKRSAGFCTGQNELDLVSRAPVARAGPGWYMVNTILVRHEVAAPWLASTEYPNRSSASWIISKIRDAAKGRQTTVGH
jgi:hypothetical protein